MKTFVSNLLFFLTLEVCLAQTTEDIKFYEDCLNPTVLILSEDSATSGTGFIVSSQKIPDDQMYLNLVYSCQHVLTSNKINLKKSKYDQNGIHQYYDSFFAKSLAANETDDVSIIAFISKEKMPTVKINKQYQPKLRDELFSIGYGLGETARYSEGRLTGVQKDLNNNTAYSFRTSVPIIFGDSGGPLFYKNEVIAIANSMKYINSSNGKNSVLVFNISFYRPIEKVNSYLEKIKFKNTEDIEIIPLYIWAESTNIIEN